MSEAFLSGGDIYNVYLNNMSWNWRAGCKKVMLKPESDLPGSLSNKRGRVNSEGTWLCLLVSFFGCSLKVEKLKDYVYTCMFGFCEKFYELSLGHL